MKPRDFAAGVAMAAFLAVGSPAMAQQGSTSGPAVGTNVTPNTAVQKQNPDQETGGVSPGGAVGTGGPGATAKSGTQGGPAPTADPAQRPTERSAQDGEGRRAGRDTDQNRDRYGGDASGCECRDRDWYRGPRDDYRGERDRGEHWREDREDRRSRDWDGYGRRLDRYRERDWEPRRWERDWEPRRRWERDWEPRRRWDRDDE